MHWWLPPLKNKSPLLLTSVEAPNMFTLVEKSRLLGPVKDSICFPFVVEDR